MYENENRIVIAGYGGKRGGARLPLEAPEGIYTGINIDEGSDELALSKTQIKVLDLISEGEIQGLATGTYNFSGYLGQIGWSGVTFTHNIVATGGTTKWLQSIYWNEIPVVDTKGLFNYQQVGVNYSRGFPNGTVVSDDIVDELTVTRLISERLRGGGELFAKKYRILDKNCIGANVNIRVNQLSKNSKEQRTLGDVQITDFKYSIFYRPVFSNRDGGSFILAKSIRILGKVSAGYIQSSKIEFDKDYSNDDYSLG